MLVLKKTTETAVFVVFLSLFCFTSATTLKNYLGYTRPSNPDEFRSLRYDNEDVQINMLQNMELMPSLLERERSRGLQKWCKETSAKIKRSFSAIQGDDADEKNVPIAKYIGSKERETLMQRLKKRLCRIFGFLKSPEKLELAVNELMCSGVLLLSFAMGAFEKTVNSINSTFIGVGEPFSVHLLLRFCSSACFLFRPFREFGYGTNCFLFW